MTAALEVLWQVLAPIFLLAGAGYLLARRLGLRPQSLARVSFYIFSPSLLFDKFSHSTLSADQLGRLALFALLTILCSGLLAWAVARLLRFERVMAAAFVLCAIAGNTGNYGLPVNQFAFGETALEPAVIYYAVSTLILATLGIYVAASGLRAPLPIERFAALAGQAAIPVMLIILGMQLADVQWRDHLAPVGLATAIKLLGGPLLGIVFAGLLGLSGVTRQAAIVEASVPTAVMAIVLATEYDTAPRFTASVGMATTLTSLVTMTLLLTFLR